MVNRWLLAAITRDENYDCNSHRIGLWIARVRQQSKNVNINRGYFSKSSEHNDELSEHHDNMLVHAASLITKTATSPDTNLVMATNQKDETHSDLLPVCSWFRTNSCTLAFIRGRVKILL
jgi:hypothetical protein